MIRTVRKSAGQRSQSLVRARTRPQRGRAAITQPEGSTALNTTTIPVARLELLERKERAHDDYLAAMKEVRANLARYQLGPDFVWLEGYRKALRDLSLAILTEAGKRVAQDG